MRGVKSNSIFSTIYHFIVPYLGPLNFTYYFNFGLLALICLVVQIFSGMFLAMHYDPSMALAFDSVEQIMREVKFGAVMRYTHANGASMFFIVVYIHMLKAMYAGSFLKPRH
jgi:ubiquinol-cytochrome c reductase cytochrome b subunit